MASRCEQNFAQSSKILHNNLVLCYNDQLWTGKIRSFNGYFALEGKK